MFVGRPSEKAQKLVETAYECMMKGIGIGEHLSLSLSLSLPLPLSFHFLVVRPGVKYRDVGAEIQSHAHSNGFSVVRSYCGHGINQ